MPRKMIYNEGMTPKNEDKRRFDSYKLTMLHDVRHILLIAAAVLAVICIVFGFSNVDGVSMMNTLQNGELVFYTRINPGISRGDIVSVHLTSGEYYIKRVIGVGGDVIDLKDGVLYVNGTAEEGSYVLGCTNPEDGSFTYPNTVPDGALFIVGDNREESVDSRSFGAVNSSQVTGVVRFSVNGLSFHLH